MKKIYFTAIALLFLGFSSFAQDAPVNTPAQTDKAMPKFEWSETTHDFGKIQHMKPKTHRFTFTNVGKAPLQLTDVKKSCGCTGIKYSKEEIPVGGDGFVEATYNGSANGSFRKSITVVSNSNPSVIQLYFKGETYKEVPVDVSGKTMMDSQK